MKYCELVEMKMIKDVTDRSDRSACITVPQTEQRVRHWEGDVRGEQAGELERRGAAGESCSRYTATGGSRSTETSQTAATPKLV